MQRTLEQIKAEAEAKKNELVPEINNTSNAGIFRQLRDVCAWLIFQFEGILYKEQDWLLEEMERRRYGRLDWYTDHAKLWQYDDNLVKTSTGDYAYEVDDPAKRLVSQASASQNSDGVMTLKVAKTDKGALVPLSADELTSFISYIERTMVAGSAINIVSQPADILKVTGEVFYNGSYAQGTIKDALEASMLAYRDTGIDFNGKVLINDVREVMRATEGVRDISIRVFVTPNGKDEIEVEVSRVLAAGYFDYLDEFIDDLTFIPDSSL